MRAIVKTQPGNGFLQLKEWPEPQPAADEIKLRVAAAGICGTDIHIIRGRWPCRSPVVLGHEFCGTVVATGPDVTPLKVGDRVVAANPARTCGSCLHCRGGNPFMCADRVSAGYMIDGAFADYICIRASQCHRLPDSVSFREAALGEPLAVAVHAVMERAIVRSDDLVLISGPGCVGLLTLVICKLQGARAIVTGLARDRVRLACAEQMGADAIVDVSREDPMSALDRLSEGRGADVVFECAGASSSLDICWKAVRKEGMLVPLGVHPGPVETDFNSIMMKELRVMGCYGYLWSSWERCIRLWRQRKISLLPLISDALPLEDYEEAFERAEEGRGAKVIFLNDPDSAH